jgi:hypothetical protein
MLKSAGPFAGANSTILSYNAGVLKIYNAASSLVRLENKNIFSALKNTSAYYNDGVEVVNLAPAWF